MSRLRFSRALKRCICIEYMQSGKVTEGNSHEIDLPFYNLLNAWIQSYLSLLKINKKITSLQSAAI